MATDTHPRTIVTDHGPPTEEPLTPPVRLMLVLSAMAVMSLFYLSLLLALLFIGALVAIDLALFFGALRVGLHRYMLGPLEALTDLATRVLKSFSLERRASYWLRLCREDGPRLFATVERVAERVGVRPPDALVLEMSAGAWVHLRGYHRGRGRCTLGLGYDLLALLSECELEAVLAHEMAHARLVQRGCWGWLSNGIRRIHQVTDALAVVHQTTRRAGKRFFIAELLAWGVSRFATVQSRLLATCSRQDEFAADRLAAEICGSETYRSVLIRLKVAGAKAEAITWRDRVLRTERREPLADWLRARLAPADENEQRELERRAMTQRRRSDFATHPVLADRLAGLPNGVTPGRATGPALGLLDEPEALGVRLLTELEQIAGDEERQESKRLLKRVKKDHRARKETPGQQVALVLIVLSILSACMVTATVATTPLGPATALVWFSFPAGALAAGLLIYRKLGFKERILLPVVPIPLGRGAEDQASIDAEPPDSHGAGRGRPSSLAIGNIEPSGGEGPEALPPLVKGRRARARHWGNRCYQSLQQGDYEGASMAARCCLEADPRSLEGLLGHGICATYFGDDEAAEQALGLAVHRYGLGASVSWALAWACAMSGDWATGEAFSLDAAARRPDEAMLWSVLAMCQWQQARLFVATHSLRQAVALAPNEARHRTLLTRLLLAAGRPKEALRELEILEEPAAGEYVVILARIRANVLLGRLDEGSHRAAVLERRHPGARTLLALAEVYSDADVADQACRYFERVCDGGFCPEALIGLGRIAYKRNDHDQARAYLLSGLDLTREPVPDARGPLELLETICGGIVALGEPADGCAAWTATLDMTALPAAVRRMGLLVYAPSFERAQDEVRCLYRAMHPGQNLSDSAVTWQPATQAQTPDRPIAPGIYGHWLERETLCPTAAGAYATAGTSTTRAARAAS